MKKNIFFFLLISGLGFSQTIEVKYYSNNFVINPELNNILDNQLKINFTQNHFSYTLTNNGELSLYKNDSIIKVNVEDAIEIDSLSNQYGLAEIRKKTVKPFDYSIKEKTYFKNFKNQELLYYFKLEEISTVKDSFIDWKWDLIDGTEEILGYKCKKAITKKFGNIITAYYTEEIFYSDGPSFYSGLPGLILKVNSKSYETYAYKISIKKEKKLIKKPVPIGNTYTLNELDKAFEEYNKRRSVEADLKRFEYEKIGKSYDVKIIKNE